MLVNEGAETHQSPGHDTEIKLYLKLNRFLKLDWSLVNEPVTVSAVASEQWEGLLDPRLQAQQRPLVADM